MDRFATRQGFAAALDSVTKNVYPINLQLPVTEKQRSSPEAMYYARCRVRLSKELPFVTFAIFLIMLGGFFRHHSGPWTSSVYIHPTVANSTLGFSKIFAISRTNSPRRQSPLRAAALTDLDVDVPSQPDWTETDIQNIQALENSTIDKGSALAWLGHLNALNQFLASSGETALFIEDDVDWDVRIRTQQIPQAAYAIRRLLNSQNSFYGRADAWDVIWLGHCGDIFNASQGSGIDIKAFHDPTLHEPGNLHAWTKDFMKDIGAEPQQRLVHPSIRPLCSFAYGVTRDAAKRLVNDLAHREPIRPAEHPCKAYDVRLLESCRDEGLRCITVNPELFHHSSGESEIFSISHGTDSEESAQMPSIGSATPNIRCSARSTKWQQLKDSLSDPSSASDVVKGLAQNSHECEIDRI